MDGVCLGRALKRAVPQLLLAALLALAFGPAAPAAEAARMPFLGVNGASIAGLPPADQDRELQQLREAGITDVRRDASWAGMERRRGHVDFTETDQWVSRLAVNGLRWAPMIGYCAGWAGTSWNGMPTDPSDFGRFAQALARRYGPAGSFWAERPDLPKLPPRAWELWNEPNARQFFAVTRSQAPRAFGDLFATARHLIRQVDPVTPIVVGGLLDVGPNTSPASFLRQMLSARPDLRGRIDGVGYHPYKQSAAQAREDLERFRGALDRMGLRRSLIDVSEVGFTLPDAARAVELRRTMRLLAKPGLRLLRIIPFQWLRPSGVEDPWALNESGRPLTASGRALLTTAKELVAAPAVRNRSPRP
jgi:hypothetical protein